MFHLKIRDVRFPRKFPIAFRNGLVKNGFTVLDNALSGRAMWASMGPYQKEERVSDLGREQHNRIRILPPQVINRIAAGEVVERPASVVKELVENAIDAGATRIDITATAGGRNLRVADNGSGMTRDDAQLAFLNHATSKIDDNTDLHEIHTLGFRGEALASIAAISRVTCLTRTADADIGCRVIPDEEGNPTITEAGCAPGTVIEIEDLFYNTPARLKFLKRPATELGYIEETVQHLALSHPGIRFSLTLQDRDAVQTSGNGDPKTSLEEVFRLRDQIRHFLPVDTRDTDKGFAVSGYISTPDMLKSSRKWLVTFVNGRSVKDTVLNKAIEAAYESLVPHGKHPFAVLFLTLPGSEVDVNVHPTKKEVRYAQANTIFSFIKNAILLTLETHGHRVYHVPEPDTSPWPTQGPAGFAPSGYAGGGYSGGSAPAAPRTGGGFSAGNYRPAANMPDSPIHTQAALNFYQPIENGETIEVSEALPQKKFKVIGQLFYTYILLETPQGLMVVDQHIASERTFFEALTRNTMANEPDIQKLITSKPIHVTPTQADLLETNRELFDKTGFTFELNSGEATLTGVPLIYLEKQKPEILFENLIAQLEETGEMKLDLDLMIATMACHSAVRAGDTLDNAEMTTVIERWLECKLPWTCPHGRPIAHTIRTEDLNRFFHRPSLPINA